MKTPPRLQALTALAIALFPLLGKAAPQPAEPGVITREEVRQGFRNGTFLAKPKDGFIAKDLEATETSEGLVATHRFASMHGVRVFRTAAGEKPDAAIARLRATGRYEYVERDYVLKALAVPNDPLYTDGSQWGLGNATQTNGSATGNISAEAGWDVRTDASSVVVAVIDTGVRLDHEDLVGNLWVNPVETAGNGIDDDANGYPDDVNGCNTFATKGSAASGNPTDDNGHGTAVASVIAASGNNGKGMTGVAWKAKIMAIKVADANGFASVSSEVAAFDYAAAKGVKIINFSFGGNSYSQASFDAIKRCRDAGVIVCLSAGNDGVPNNFEPTFPGAYNLENIITVGATDKADALTSFSNYGAGSVDLAAPGLNIEVADYFHADKYKTMSGTSFSAPMVTGVLALVKAQYPNDNYRGTINRVLHGVDVLPGLAGKVASQGRLNLAKALASTNTEPINDRSSTPVAITDYSDLIRGCSLNATVEPNRPAALSNLTNPTLWWSWKPGYSINAIIDTSGSSVDTILNVYTAGTNGTLTPTTAAFATNDDFGGKTSSRVAFVTDANTTYMIAISGKNGATGLLNATVSFKPNNDSFTGAQAISSASDVSSFGINRLASKDTGELSLPNSYGGITPAGATVWYSWTAPASGKYSFSVYGQGFDAATAIYTGTTLSTLTRIASGSTIEDVNEPAEFNAVSGTKYYLAIDGYTGAYGGSSGYFAYAMSTVSHLAAMPGSVFGSPTLNPINNQIVVGDEYGVLSSFTFSGVSGVMLPDASYVNFVQLDASLFLQTPAAALNGSLYVGNDRAHLYHLSSTLSTLDRVNLEDTSISTPVALGVDNTVYVHSDDGYLHAYTPSLGEKWKLAIPGSGYGGPSIDSKGRLRIGSDNGHLYTVDTNTGLLLSDSNENDPINSAPAIDAQDGFVFATKSGRVSYRDSNGSLVWNYQAASGVRSSPVLDAAGNVVFGSDDGTVYSISPTGNLRWSYATGDSNSICSPAVDANGVIYIGSFDGYLYAINNDGTLKHRYAVCRGAFGSPMITGTTLYFGAYDKRVYSIDIGVGAANSAWPMFRQNARHTGRRLQTTTPTFTVTPASGTVAKKSSLTLSAHAEGQEGITYQWYLNGTAVYGANGSSLTISSILPTDAGNYTVKATNGLGTTESTAGVIAFATPPPSITAHPVSQTAFSGSPITFSVTTGEAGATYQWYLNGTALSGKTGSTLSFTSIQNSDAGDYSVAVSTAAGTTRSRAATLAVGTPDEGTIKNMSVRSVAGHGGNPLIVGFVVVGGSKDYLLRAAGPGLGVFGVPDTLPDPVLNLYSNGSVIATNDNWGDGGLADSLAVVFAQVGAFGIQDKASKDAALVNSITGATTAVVSPASGTASGIAIVELYDTTLSTTPHLVNVSARNYASSGASTLIAGFVIGGNVPKKILVRGIGPSLSQFSIFNVLADPKLELHRQVNGNDTLFASNDDWTDEPGTADANMRAGAFTLIPNSLDAALVVTVPPGQYTAQVSGVNDVSGEALVEVYELQ